MWQYWQYPGRCCHSGNFEIFDSQLVVRDIANIAMEKMEGMRMSDESGLQTEELKDTKPAFNAGQLPRKRNDNAVRRCR